MVTNECLWCAFDQHCFCENLKERENMGDKSATKQIVYRGAMPPKGVRCYLEQRGARKKYGCYPNECLMCGWNLDKQIKVMKVTK